MSWIRKPLIQMHRSRVALRGDPIGFHRESAPIPDEGATYSFINSSSSAPLNGQMICNTSNPAILNVSAVDFDGIDRTAGLMSIKIGDTLFVGLVSGVIASTPTLSLDRVRLTLTAPMAQVDGEYLCRVVAVKRRAVNRAGI